jgi:hypothetical protein
MSVSIKEVVEAGGYNLSTLEDARWLKSQESQFEELIADAEALIEEEEERENAEAEAEYKRNFPDEEE